MGDLVKISLNEKGLIDKELLKTNVRKYYQFNNEYKIYQEVSKCCDSLLNKTRLLNKEVEKWKCVEPFF